MQRSIFIGWDPREAAAFAVARSSLKRNLTQPVPVRGLVLDELIYSGLYTRPTTRKVNGEGRFEMVDVLSIREDYDGRVATQHANARFLVPHLAKEGWALFCDGDVLFRGNVSRLFDDLDPKFAAYCVKHQHEPSVGVKMDGQLQTRYARKNWSSFLIFNCGHEANRSLTLGMVNTLPGRDLHRLSWLEDGQIGGLGVEWNWLAGCSAPIDDPKVVHFTLGTPDMPGYEKSAYADEWRAELNRWAA